MIWVNRLGGGSRPLAINAELIETVEETPDTVITLTTGKKLVVRERAAEVIRRVIEYRAAVLAARPVDGSRSDSEGEQRQV